MVKLEQHFKKDQMLKNKYFNFMGELLDNGHMVIADSEDNVPSGKVWYQSHFCVNTSKTFRFVFDCSAKLQGVSANDFLFKGPCMQKNLVGVLTCFRTHVHALISDLRKLYYLSLQKNVS